MSNDNTTKESKFSRQLYLNSRYANYITDTTKNSQCTFNLNEPINVPPGRNCYVSVVSAEIPNTIFSVDNSTAIPLIFTKPSPLLITATASTAANLITLTSTAGIYPGMQVVFNNTFGNMVSGTIYFVMSTSGLNITITTAYAGTTAFTTGAATGTMNCTFNSILQATATTAGTNTITVSTAIGITVNNQIAFNGTTFGNINASTIYYVTSVPTATTITVSLTLGGSNIVLTNGTGLMYVGTSITQTFTIFGSAITQGLPSNSLLTNGNYSSSVYNTNNPTSLATQMSKSLSFINDGAITNIVMVIYYSIAQSKFLIGWYPNGGYFTLLLNNLIFGANNQTFYQLQTATAIATNVTQNATNQTFVNLTMCNSIPKFFPPYIILGSNMQCRNQAVGETRVATLAKVIVDVPYNSFIFYRNFYGYSNMVSNRELFTLEITLYDETGVPVNMQGASWSCTLQIDFQ